MAGQSMQSSLEIQCDQSGHWISMKMVAPQGEVKIERDSLQSKIITEEKTKPVISKRIQFSLKISVPR